MENRINAIVIHPDDTVAVVVEELHVGDSAVYSIQNEFHHINVKEEIPIYHKIAVALMKKGDAVYKYGQVMGKATVDIMPGCHVHLHNVTSMSEDLSLQTVKEGGRDE